MWRPGGKEKRLQDGKKYVLFHMVMPLVDLQDLPKNRSKGDGLPSLCYFWIQKLALRN